MEAKSTKNIYRFDLTQRFHHFGRLSSTILIRMHRARKLSISYIQILRIVQHSGHKAKGLRDWETYKSENFITSEECQLKGSKIWRIELFSISQSSQPVLLSAVSIQVEHGKTTETSLLLHPVTQWHLWMKILTKTTAQRRKKPEASNSALQSQRRCWISKNLAFKF